MLLSYRNQSINIKFAISERKFLKMGGRGGGGGAQIFPIKRERLIKYGAV